MYVRLVKSTFLLPVFSPVSFLACHVSSLISLLSYILFSNLFVLNISPSFFFKYEGDDTSSFIYSIINNYKFVKDIEIC